MRSPRLMFKDEDGDTMQVALLVNSDGPALPRRLYFSILQDTDCAGVYIDKEQAKQIIELLVTFVNTPEKKK